MREKYALTVPGSRRSPIHNIQIGGKAAVIAPMRSTLTKIPVRNRSVMRYDSLFMFIASPVRPEV